MTHVHKGFSSQAILAQDFLHSRLCFLCFFPRQPWSHATQGMESSGCAQWMGPDPSRPRPRAVGWPRVSSQHRRQRQDVPQRPSGKEPSTAKTAGTTRGVRGGGRGGPAEVVVTAGRGGASTHSRVAVGTGIAEADRRIGQERDLLRQGFSTRVQGEWFANTIPISPRCLPCLQIDKIWRVG